MCTERMAWGATAKVRQLDNLYPGLTEEQRAIRANITIGTPIEHLDLGAVIKISQAVSGKMDLDKLINTLMLTAIEHAGASRGLLILLHRFRECLDHGRFRKKLRVVRLT